LYRDGRTAADKKKSRAEFRRKTKKFREDISKRENMGYDGVRDEYTCANNKKLRAAGTERRVSKSGYESEVTVYGCEDCEGCGLREGCTSSKKDRKCEQTTPQDTTGAVRHIAAPVKTKSFLKTSLFRVSAPVLGIALSLPGNREGKTAGRDGEQPDSRGNEP
jgi:hypothetical protein